MSASSTILVQPIADLTALGIPQDAIKFGDLTMESDVCIAIREKVGEKTSLTIVELAQGNQVVRRPISAESAIMNPRGGIIALRAGSTIQVFDIGKKEKLKSYKFDEDVSSAGIYWRWATNEIVAIVTNTSVYHWSITNQSEPEKIFERHASLSGAQIISYKLSDDQKWALLVGIAPGQVPNTIDGNMQLYSIEKRVSQPLQGHAGCFTTLEQGGQTRQIFSFVEKKPALGPKLFITEIGKEKDAVGGVFKVTPQDIPFPPEASADFAVTLLPSRKFDVLYLITKLGYLYVLDLVTAETLYRNRISQETIFATCSTDNDASMLGVTARRGQVLKISLNESQLVPYLLQLGKSNVAMRLATKLGLPGADGLYVQEFERAFNAGDYAAAAKCAAESPGGRLRTIETIQRFQRLPAQPGQPAPALQYFQALLAKGQLNSVESIELARPVVQQGASRLPMIEQWIKEDKLTCSETLGDLVATLDPKMALAIYLRGNAPEKVVMCFVQMGDFANVVAYSKKTGYHPDYTILLQNLVRQDPKRAEAFAKMLVNPGDGAPAMVSISVVVDIFMSLNRIQETTGFLLEALKPDRPEDGPLQTRLLELNLLGGAPQIADAIFQSDMFHHYDRARVAKLCEKAGLFQRALEHSQDPADIKRIVLYTQAINPEFLVNYFATLSPLDAIECLHALLQHNLKQNLAIVVQIASKYYELLTPQALLDMFEKFKSYEGIYYFTGSIMPFTQDKNVHFKYIESATKLGQIEQVVKACRESTAYDPIQVKEFLIMEKVQDPRPLINVCDRHGFIDELTSYLYNNKLHKYIEVYVEKVAPQNAPQVIGKLLDLDAEEAFIVQILNSVRRECPVPALVDEVEKRNRLRLLRPWLEQRVAEGNTETSTHDALAKIYITINHEPEAFLLHNQFYNSKTVGAFCKKLDPHLAFVAYRRAWGQCDDELLELTSDNELFKDQARYLVERSDPELWARVLAPENKYRQRVVDETVQTALPECRDSEKISTTVRAFMTAKMPHELIAVLDRLVLQGTPGDGFSENPSLQNLLMMTSVQTEPTRVMDLIHRLDHVNATVMAEMMCRDEYKLYEEAFEILKKANLMVEAVEILLIHLDSIDRAVEFAKRIEDPKVWSRVGRSQLDANFVKQAIDSFITADDPEHYLAVIQAAEREERNEDLVRFLRMARKKIKEKSVDSSLVYALAKSNKLTDLEEFVASPNVADVQDVGDRLFNEKQYEAAAILYESISNNSQLARAYVRLGKYKEAVDCARKASNVKTWKEVNMACVEAQEWRLAEVSGTHILKHPDHVDDLVSFYESRGHFTELIALFEKGLALEGANKSVFTGLAVLYAKHTPEKLLDHIRTYGSRLIMGKVLHACEEGRLWKEAALLHEECGEIDNAVRCMIDHPESAWDKTKFLDLIIAVRNPELYYKAITFYVQYVPDQLGALLQCLTPKLDHARCVQVLRKTGALPYHVAYLKAVQKANISAVNDALNEVLIEDGDFDGLQGSIDDYSNFDHISLAQKLEKHDLLQFRRVAANLYSKQKKYADAFKILKQDRMYKEVVNTAATSRDEKLVMEVLNFFVDANEKECFAATLYACYDLIAPETVLELAWRKGLVDQAMPFLIQWTSQTHVKLKELDERTRPAGSGGAGAGGPGGGAGGFMMDPLGNPYMIANVAYNNQQDPNMIAYQQQQQYQQQLYLQQQQQQGYNNGGL
jgi:clathrin heavy chain